MRYISAITFFLRTTLAHHWELEKSIYSPVWSSLLLQKGGFWMIEFDAMAWKRQKSSIMNQRATSIRFPVRTHAQTTRVYFVHHGLFLASLLERFFCVTVSCVEGFKRLLQQNTKNINISTELAAKISSCIAWNDEMQNLSLGKQDFVNFDKEPNILWI